MKAGADDLVLTGKRDLTYEDVDARWEVVRGEPSNLGQTSSLPMRPDTKSNRRELVLHLTPLNRELAVLCAQ